jgi:hypothetical protein
MRLGAAKGGKGIGEIASMPGSRSHDAVIRVYDAAGNVIEHKGDFKEW